MSETPSGARARASPGPAAAPSASPLHQGRRGPDLAAAASSSPGSRADRRTRPAGVGVAAAASPSSGCPRLPSAPHAAPAAATTAAGERCAQGACAVYVELGRAALRKAGEDTARVDGGTCVLGLLGDRFRPEVRPPILNARTGGDVKELTDALGVHRRDGWIYTRLSKRSLSQTLFAWTWAHSWSNVTSEDY